MISNTKTVALMLPAESYKGDWTI